ncbi:hypothetical protein VTI28DRAFT_8254 [Corynascus sepedonium]
MGITSSEATTSPEICAQIKFKDEFRTNTKAEITVPIAILSRIKPLDMDAVRNLSVVMAAVAEALYPGSSSQWKSGGYSLN